MSSTATVTNPILPQMPRKKKRRKGKGARAMARRNAQKEENEKKAEEETEKKRILEKRLEALGLKRGDKIETVPSSRYPESVVLTVNNVTYNPNRDDFMVSFMENTNSGYAWGKNLGASYFKLCKTCE